MPHGHEGRAEGGEAGVARRGEGKTWGEGGQAVGVGPQKVGCGPTTELQASLPSHGLHRLLSSLGMRLASDCSLGPLCCPLSPRGLGKGPGHLGSGLWRRVTLRYDLSVVAK